MLLYLFTLCRSQSAEFKKAIGCSNEKDALPAGVIYLSANISLLDIDDYEESDEIIKRAADELDRSGILLDNGNVLLAMNEDLNKNFLAGVKRNTKDGMIVGSALASSEQFTQIYSQLESVIIKLATELRSGNAAANPLKHGKSIPCEYCSLKPFCRNTNN
jgi:ATP-dependent helicase/nuclease subunit B